jgi:hypothetical protein
MKLLRILAWIAAVIVTSAAVLGVIAVVVNLRDAPPSAHYVRLKKLVANRPAVADGDNAFVFLLGFGVGPDANPQQIGERRLAWLEGLDHDMSKLRADPAGDVPGFSGMRSAAVASFFKACNADEPHDCPHAFDSAPGPDGWSDRDRELLARYHAIVTRPRWREHVGNDVSQPIPAYADLLAGQRLALLDLRGADARTMRDSLSRDLAFWRNLLASSDYLITKMIAVAGLRQHFQFGNLLLRYSRATGHASAIPDGWRQEITRPELSLERVMAGELTLMERAWHMPKGTLFFHEQDISNEFAADYVELVQAFDVSLADYRRTDEQWAKRPVRHPFPSRLYDIGGDYLRRVGAVAYHGYAPRIAAVEAWRRAALTTAELREHGTPLAQVPDALERAPLRNPFDGKPFAWSTEEQAVVYQGTEDQSRGRRRQVYPY